MSNIFPGNSLSMLMRHKTHNTHSLICKLNFPFNLTISNSSLNSYPNQLVEKCFKVKIRESKPVIILILTSCQDIIEISIP